MAFCCARAASGNVTADPASPLMKSRRLICHPKGWDIVSAQNCTGNRATDVRFGSKADMCGAKRYVRFTPDSDRESRHPRRVTSALPPKRTCAVQLAMSA